MRRIRVALATISIAVVLCGCFFALRTARGQEASADPSGGSTRTLADALLAEVRFPAPRRDGSPVYAPHCRRAHGGCEARMRRMAGLFERAGLRHNVDPWLLGAIAVRESGGNPEAIGARGEWSVFQLHPQSRHGRTARRLCDESPRDCQTIVVDAAARLVRAVLDRCGSELDALGAYHSGRCGEDEYARSVIARRDRMRGGR